MSSLIAPVPGVSRPSWRTLRQRGDACRLEAFATGLALAGLVASLVGGFQVRRFSWAASDFKTLFASAFCFTHGRDAYAVGSLAQVFTQQGIQQPASWFAHSAVYPPFTLVLMAPLTLLPLVQAAWLWLLLSAACIALATFRIVRVAAEHFELQRPWRLAIIGIIAALPLLSFGLNVGNVSVVVGSLCILVALAEFRGRPWQAVALATAVLLKPHIAIWLLLGLLLTGESGDRRTALRSAALCAGVVLLLSFWRLGDPHLAAQFTSYHHVLTAELGSGSMNPASLRMEDNPSQIIGLRSLLGYWTGAGWVNTALTGGLLALLAGLLVSSARSLRLRWLPGLADGDFERRLLLLNGCFAFGLIATYHRAHDALVLYMLLPWVAARLRRSFGDVPAWLLLSGLVLLSVGLTKGAAATLMAQRWSYPVARFLVYRQSGAVAFVLAVTLAWLAFRSGRARPDAPAM